MVSENTWDSAEAEILKECYDQATQYEKNIASQEILREKSKKIDFPPNFVPVQVDVSHNATEMEVVSEVLYELTHEGYSIADHSGPRQSYIYNINNLPNSAEKEYILALLALSNGTWETQRLSALSHLSVALSYSPNDPRFLTLASVLQDVDK